MKGTGMLRNKTQRNKIHKNKIHKNIALTILMGGILMISLFGCGETKYKLTFGNSGFTSDKTKYAAGETVTVCYDMIASDTDYTFFSNDVEFDSETYDNSRGYVITFTMPDHDVKVDLTTRNSMEYDPGAINNNAQDDRTARVSFESFDGGGPEFTVIIEDEDIADYYAAVVYDRPDHEEMNGAGKNVVVEFGGLEAGETQVLIKERSPIADNLDHRYRLIVDEDLKVKIEEISVKDLNEASQDTRLYIGTEEVPVTWEENESVNKLKSMLPLDIRMSKYGDFEQVGSLGYDVISNDEKIDAECGDIMLYSGDQIVLFYGTNSWEYTRLGRIDLPEDDVKRLLGNKDVNICIE